MAFGVDPGGWKGLLDQADAGRLLLDPEIGAGLDKVCDRHIDRLGDVLSEVRNISHITGFGAFESGRVLERKFSLTASGSDRALDAVVRRHIEVVVAVKEIVARAISNFVAQEQAAVARISASERAR
ncbi:hypothetical protein DFR68_104324 [Nocardia mexicana]|uniref:Uncharacterized protein n=2 Tax=Nocardia mexicana TaxID=279262 RepID=A0A370H603_9NOCA|nr:hypothetical protein DFR68_104324 [Nocardia mexicana]